MRGDATPHPLQEVFFPTSKPTTKLGHCLHTSKSVRCIWGAQALPKGVLHPSGVLVIVFWSFFSKEQSHDAVSEGRRGRRTHYLQPATEKQSKSVRVKIKPARIGFVERLS